MGLSFETVYIDQVQNGSEILESLKTTTNQNTVPYIYIGGKLIGGCTDLKALSSSSRLEPLLSAAGKVIISSCLSFALSFLSLFASPGVTLKSSAKKQILESLAVLPETTKPVKALFQFPEMADDR